MGKAEDPIHRSIVNWLRTVLPKDCIVHHSANEGVRGGRSGQLDGARRKAMGQVAGWPDITILTHVGVFFMEVKAEGGRLSQAQAVCIKRMRALGLGVDVVRSIDDARECLQAWGVGFNDITSISKAAR